MAQDSAQSNALWFPGAIVIGLITAGYVFYQPALQTSRPAEKDRWSQDSRGYQDVEVRLWQDPFFAMDQHNKELEALKRSDLPRYSVDFRSHGADKLKHRLATKAGLEPDPDAKKNISIENKCQPTFDRTQINESDCLLVSKGSPPFNGYVSGGWNPLVLARYSQLTKETQPFKRAGGGAAPLVLFITLPGAPYAEQAERRRRVRYSVLSALFSYGYAPEDEEHMGFFRTARSRSIHCLKSEVNERFPREVPYEFVRADRLMKWDSKKRFWILLVWLDNESVKNCPVGSIKALIDEIRPANRFDIEYQVIGPSDSGTLVNLAREGGCGMSGNATTTTKNAPITIWSPWASASENELLLAQGQRDCKVPLVESRLTNGNAVLVRLTPDNDALVSAVLRELKLRDVDPIGAARAYARRKKTEQTEHQVLSDFRPSEPEGAAPHGILRKMLTWITPEPTSRRHRVLIISEFDSPYQRSLLQTFRRIVGNGCDGILDAEIRCTSQDGTFSWLFRFSYLRGVDGRTPMIERTALDDENKERPKGKDQGAPGREIESSFGNGQFDYLRRLADRIQEEEARLEDRGQSGFGAIGVLGMDTYDKLTILQALRARFPGRVFFTTGIDARYLDARETAWTRNLVVVSPFGLELDGRLQRGVPPFRESYQTAAYFATLVAAGADLPIKKKIESVRTRRDEETCNAAQLFADKDCSDGPVRRWLYPQTFEIGRTVAFQYPTGGLHYANTNICAPWNIFACSEIHDSPSIFPRPTEVQRAAGVVAAILAVGLVAVLWHFRQSLSRRRAIFLVIVGLVSILTVWFWEGLWESLSEQGDGEPALLLEGISVWPAQLIRLVSMAISLAALHFFWYALKDNIQEIQKRFAEGPSGSVKVSQEETPKEPFLESGSPLANDAKCLAMGACPPEEQRNRGWRIVIIAGVYFALGYALIMIWPVGVPSRGRFAFELNFWITIIAVVAYSLLLGLVLEAFHSCIRFVRDLRNDSIQWSAGLAHATAKRLGIKEEQARVWLTIDVIAKRSKVVSRLIYGPFVVLFVVIVARSPIFEHWVWPKSLLVFVGTSLLLMIYAATSFRKEMEATRKLELQKLRIRVRTLLGSSEGSNEAKQIESMISEIENLREGAFASYTDQPFIKAPLILVAGYAGNLLIGYLSLPGH